jgi:hypothetical protein
MRRLLAFALLIALAQTLTACVVYDDPYYHHHYYHDHDDYWHDHDGWRR